MTDPDAIRHREINFELCRAIDLTKLGIVLDTMEQAGMHPNFVRTYRQAAEALLDLLRSENNRIHRA
jgi:hypothetical protein